MAQPDYVEKQQPSAKKKRLRSLMQLSHEFDISWNKAKRRLAETPPDGLIKDKPAWYIKTAAPALLDLPEQPNTGSAENLKPKDRLDWIKAERELVRLRSEAGDLIPAEEHRDGLASLTKLFVSGVELLVDKIEQKCGLTATQAAVVEKQCDAVREQMYEENARLSTGI